MPEPDTDTREIPVDHIRTAERELGILIEITGGPDHPDPMRPLARLKNKLQEAEEDNDEFDPYTYGWVISAINEIAEEHGVDLSPEDPLQDDIFRARTAFQKALEPDSDTSAEAP